MLTRRLLIALFALFTAIALQAQTFEIRTVNKGFGVIGVEMRQTSNISLTNTNLITDIVFGIKWRTSYNVDLASAITTGYNIKKSGIRMMKDSFYFQAFFADNTPYQLPEDWTQNTWIEVMSVANTLNGSGEGIFEICEAGFEATTNPNIGIDLTDFSPAVAGSATGVLLPVGLLSFSVAPVNRKVELSWSTSSELNNKGFEVQRSDGNAGNYTTVDFVNSKNNGDGRNNYNFTDDNVVGGIRYYYRLRQVDADGNFRFSEIKDAILDKIKNELIQLAPNPASKIINLVFAGDCPAVSVTLKITDAKGVTVSSWKEAIQPGKQVTKNITNFAAGQYFLTVENVGHLLYKTVFQKID